MRLQVTSALWILALAFAGPLSAYHSVQAVFDIHKTITVQGNGGLRGSNYRNLLCALKGDRLSQFTRQAGRYRRHSEIIPGGTNYWTGLFAQEKRATNAVTTRNRSKTPRPNAELSATPYAAVKETSAKTSNASVMQTDKSSGPKPCDCCLQTQREALITMAKRTRTSAMLRAIPIEDRILRPAAEGRQAAHSILELESKS